MEVIQTKSTSNATMDTNPIVLRESKITRLIFCPSWVSTSSNPLRGGFRFQRKSPNDTWEDIDHKSLTTLKKDEGYELNLDGSEMAILFSELQEIQKCLVEHGHSAGTRIIELTDENANGIFLQIGDVKNRDLVVSQLRAMADNNFENLGAVVGRARLENAIDEFESNISNSDESFWQQYFEKRPWVLQQVFSSPVIFLNGETYLGGKNSRGRQGSGGSATDFLFKNGSNGSFAVIEIKTPSCGLVGSKYRGNKGTDENNEIYCMHSDLSGGVVQMENQIHVAVENFKTIIGADYPELNHLNPSGVLIAGNRGSLTDTEQKSFDLFRKSLGKNQVFTFDEVLARLKLLKTVYEN
jgi:hypothetical protein